MGVHFPDSRIGNAALILAGMLCVVPPANALTAEPATDGQTLRDDLTRHYPSLLWVERYRQTYPAEAQGDNALWRTAQTPALESDEQIIDALVALQDQHVAIAGPGAGKQETLGILFRTSSDGAMVVWRRIDPSVTKLSEGEQVLSIEGAPVAGWLEQAAKRTFGGNRRSRMAEAATKLAMASHAEHAATGPANRVHLTVRGADGTVRAVELAYQAVTSKTGAAIAQAVERSDLPEVVPAGKYRVGVLRFGAFAPQYDADFNKAADAADVPGAGSDAPMLAGFCTLVRKRLAGIDALAAQSDMLLIDLRGNLGGFVREARLLALALTRQPLARTFDMFATDRPGQVKLVEQQNDASCGNIATPRPLLVWTDAGTRSAGEFMAAWLWSAGAITIGERTIGAGGGRDADAAGLHLQNSGLRVKYSGNFSVFDNALRLQSGETDELALLDMVSQNRFAPSRTRPFAIQAAGLAPDIPLPTAVGDLFDGGRSGIERVIAELIHSGQLPPNPGGKATP